MGTYLHPLVLGFPLKMFLNISLLRGTVGRPVMKGRGLRFQRSGLRA